jgi:molybdopterin-guanine dinucleotide biosynthesis protein A
VNAAGSGKVALGGAHFRWQIQQDGFWNSRRIFLELDYWKTLLNGFDTGLAAETATAGDRPEALRRSAFESHVRRKFNVNDVLGGRFNRPKIARSADDLFREKKTRSQFFIMARGTHRGGDCRSANPNFEWLFDHDVVGHTFVLAILLSAEDAAGADSFHARRLHENADMKRISFSAVLLAGGESRRMGRDKATIEFWNQPLWRRQLDLLRALKPRQLFVAARARPDWLPGDAELLLDDPPSRGPLSGLTNAVRAMRTTHLMALAIDMPFLTSAQMQRLWSLAEPGRGVVPVIGGQAQPLSAIYSAKAGEDFASALAGSDFSLQPIVRVLADAGKMRLVPISETDAQFFRNVNAPHDLSEFNA